MLLMAVFFCGSKAECVNAAATLETTVLVDDGFSTDSGKWTYLGNATRANDGDNQYIQLTDAVGSQTGTIWLNTAIAPPFTATFKLRIIQSWYSDPADGIIFMFNKQQNLDTVAGGGMGFEVGNGYGIEFDSYPNTGNDYHDPDYFPSVPYHMAIIKNTPDHAVGENQTMPVTPVPDLVGSSGGEWHDVRVEVGTDAVDVFYDGTKQLTYSGTIDHTYNGIGFTAGTGALYSWQQIDDVKITKPSVLVDQVDTTTVSTKFKARDTIPITVSFSNTVTVSGTPSLALKDGKSAVYTSGSGTTQLTFEYTVADGDNIQDLDVTSLTELEMTDGTLTGPSGTEVELTLSAATALAGKHLLVDAQAPTGSAVVTSNDGSNAHVQVITDDDGGSGVTEYQWLSSADETPGGVWQSIESDFDVTLPTGALGYKGYLWLRDTMGNVGGPFASNELGLVRIQSVDTSVTKTAFKAGDTVPIQVTFSDTVTVTGTPMLRLTGGAFAFYTGGSGTSTLTFTYTVSAGDNIAELDTTSSTALDLNGGTITGPTDAVLLTALPESPLADRDLLVDTTPPTGGATLTVSGANSALVQVSAEDSGSGLAAYQWVNVIPDGSVEGEWKTSESSNPSFTIAIPAEAHSVQGLLLLLDKAGNVGGPFYSDVLVAPYIVGHDSVMVVNGGFDIPQNEAVPLTGDRDFSIAMWIRAYEPGILLSQTTDNDFPNALNLSLLRGEDHSLELEAWGENDGIAVTAAIEVPGATVDEYLPEDGELWGHLAVEKSGGRLALYLNGHKVGDAAFDGDVAAFDQPAPLRFGTEMAGFDDIQLYDQAMGDDFWTEHWQLEAKPGSPEYVALKAYYPIDERFENPLTDVLGGINGEFEDDGELYLVWGPAQATQRLTLGVPSFFTVEAVDENGSALQYSVNQAPTKGSLMPEDADGHYRYTPQAAGYDSFTIAVSDGAFSPLFVTYRVMNEYSELGSFGIGYSLSKEEPTKDDVAVTASVYGGTVTSLKWFDGEIADPGSRSDGVSFEGSFSATHNGTYTIYAVRDDGQQAVRYVNITNIDRTAPVISVPGPFVVLLGSSFVPPDPIVTDNMDRVDQLTVTKPGAVDTSVIGSQELTYTAMDRAGNLASYSTSVYVTSLGFSVGSEAVLVPSDDDPFRFDAYTSNTSFPLFVTVSEKTPVTVTGAVYVSVAPSTVSSVTYRYSVIPAEGLTVNVTLEHAQLTYAIQVHPVGMSDTVGYALYDAGTHQLRVRTKTDIARSIDLSRVRVQGMESSVIGVVYGAGTTSMSEFTLLLSGSGPTLVGAMTVQLSETTMVPQLDLLPGAMTGTNGEPISQLKIPVMNAGAVRGQVDTAADGIHLDDVLRAFRNGSDVNGDGQVDRYDVLTILSLLN
jgi:hypothetical protein